MKTLSGSQVTHVSGGFIVNPVTIKAAVVVGKAVGNVAVGAATAAGAYFGTQAVRKSRN